MSGCGNCCGNCGGCGSLVLSKGELKMVMNLWQIPYLPVARSADSFTPIYLEESDYSPEEYSLILQCLEKRGLISIDYDAPLKHCNLRAYAPYPVVGSFTLTERGQQVAEQIELQGYEQES